MPTVETIKLQADVGDAIKSIDKMTKAIEDLEKKQEEQAKTHIEELKKAVEATKKSEKATSKLAKGFKGVGLAMKAAGFGLVMKLVDGITNALMKNQQVADAVETVFAAIGIVFKEVSDVLIDVFNQVNEATGGFDALQKVIGGLLTIAITPLKLGFYAIKLALQTAQLAWEESFFGDKDPETIKRLREGIKETGQDIKDVAQDAVEAGKQVANNFVEAVGEVGSLATAAVDGVSKVIEDLDIKQTISRAKNLVELKKNYERVALEQQRLIEMYDEEAEKQRQIRDDVSISIQDRIAANKELGDVLERQIAAEQAAAQANIDNLKQQIKLEGESEELKNALFSAETELLAISAKVTGLKSEQLTNENALIAEQNAILQTQITSKNELAASDARFKAESIENEYLRLEALQEVFNQETEMELARLQTIIDTAAAGTQAKVDAEAAFQAKKQEMEQGNATFEKKIGEAKKKISDDEAATKEENLSKVGGALNNLGQLLGEQTAAGKATAIAAATIDTYQSAQSSYKSLSGIPIIGPALGFAAAAAAIVGGVAQVKKIASTQIPKPPGGGGGVGGGGGAGPSAAPQPVVPSFNVVGASDTNQLANVLGEQEQEPVQAYVVATDVTTAQSMERNIIDTTSL